MINPNTFYGMAVEIFGMHVLLPLQIRFSGFLHEIFFVILVLSQVFHVILVNHTLARVSCFFSLLVNKSPTLICIHCHNFSPNSSKRKFMHEIIRSCVWLTQMYSVIKELKFSEYDSCYYCRSSPSVNENVKKKLSASVTQVIFNFFTPSQQMTYTLTASLTSFFFFF